ncbi:MAG: hypothetical protein IT385_23785 [Deltaproteobacteria bacterium]|nr:hypothetical protein [Deltaproteobacteria bacterium]
MARAIVVARSDGPDAKTSRFTFSAIDRDKLYGQRKRLVVDERGQPCVAAQLTTDGSVMLLPDSRAMLYLDERGDVIERSALLAVDAAGNPLPRLEPTLDVPQPLMGPVPPERVLDHNALSVYQIASEGPDALDEELVASLARGEIWETTFNYTAAYERQTLFLLQGADGLYGIVAEPAEIAWVERDAPPPAPDDEPIGDEDLDFSMF